MKTKLLFFFLGLSVLLLVAQVGIGPETAFTQTLKLASTAAAARTTLQVSNADSLAFAGLTITNASSTTAPMVRFKSDVGLPQMVLEDADAADAQEPFWYLQNANNGSAGRFYLGYADRTGTSLTGNTDILAAKPTGLDLYGIFTSASIVTTNSIAVGGGTAMTKFLTAAAALDFGNIVTFSTLELTITVTGATTNGVVILGTDGVALEAGIMLNGRVTSADTVTVRAGNITVGSIDPAIRTVRATVIEY